MDTATAFLTICLLATGGAFAWWLRGKVEDWITTAEFYSDDEDE